MKKRSDAAYLVVKNKVDKAKRSGAEKVAAKAASMSAAAAGGVGEGGVGGSGSSNSPAVTAVKTEDVRPVVETLDLDRVEHDAVDLSG